MDRSRPVFAYAKFAKSNHQASRSFNNFSLTHEQSGSIYEAMLQNLDDDQSSYITNLIKTNASKPQAPKQALQSRENSGSRVSGREKQGSGHLIESKPPIALKKIKESKVKAVKKSKRAPQSLKNSRVNSTQRLSNHSIPEIKQHKPCQFLRSIDSYVKSLAKPIQVSRIEKNPRKSHNRHLAASSSVNLEETIHRVRKEKMQTKEMFDMLLLRRQNERLRHNLENAKMNEYEISEMVNRLQLQICKIKQTHHQEKKQKKEIMRIIHEFESKVHAFKHENYFQKISNDGETDISRTTIDQKTISNLHHSILRDRVARISQLIMPIERD